MFMRRAQKLDPDTKVGVWGMTSSLAKVYESSHSSWRGAGWRGEEVNCKPLASEDGGSISDVLFLLTELFSWIIWLKLGGFKHTWHKGLFG